MKLKEHYRRLYNQFGDSAQSVQYTDSPTQNKRFEVLTEIDTKINSAIDVGCGLGHLYEYLRKKQPSVKYLGLDFVEEFVEAANSKFLSDNVKFDVFNILDDDIPKGYDYVLLSGVFNNVMDNNWEFMKMSIKKMFEACNKGVAFNAMSTYVDYYDDNLYYVDPCKVFNYCKKELNAKITLRNDYLVKVGSIPFEFVIYLYK